MATANSLGDAPALKAMIDALEIFGAVIGGSATRARSA